MTRRQLLLDPGMDLTLRPMRYPEFYDRYRDAIKNTWTVEEVDLHTDLADLAKLSPIVNMPGAADQIDDSEAIACSLANPESCEACQ